MGRIPVIPCSMILAALLTLFPFTNAAQAAEVTQAEREAQEESETQAGREAQTENETQTEDGENETQVQGISVSAPSAILMEASTGKVIFEKDADTVRPPASVTKIMTLLLIFDAMEEGILAPEDPVTVSEYAASMGGSQVFLEPGETQTADTMIKCIAVASANDACVAMAEHICGSEEQFVARMNRRAEELKMDHTHFVNCNGLDTEGHETTVRDIARMSRELITKYPKIRDYSMIWMDTITHETARGVSEFGLTNTNKLVRQYPGATGLKTGSTDQAKFCVSATAEKNHMELIAVILGAETSKDRFRDASALLDYGFGACRKYTDDGLEALEPVAVLKGQETAVAVRQEPFVYLDTTGADLTGIEKKAQLKDSLTAPVNKGDQAGEMIYTLNGKEIGRAAILAAEAVAPADYKTMLERILESYFM